MTMLDEVSIHTPSTHGNSMATDISPLKRNGSPAALSGQSHYGYHAKEETSFSGRVVDLRSDTLTKPSPAMRAAMSVALVGDDVLGLDPTANELQESVAKVFGKEAGLFVPSGTMGNLIAVLVWCNERGSEVILGSESHIHNYEQGGVATLGGVYPTCIENKADGTMDLSKLEAAIRPANDVHFVTTRLICLENTHNRCGGRCISAEYTDKVGELAKRYGLNVHVDGARIFNAATALGVSVERLVRSADSVSICLSKGLAAPIGSVLVGSHEIIEKARKLRKALGGGMRQIGVVCAAGLISLHDMSRRLEDHDNARTLAEGLNGMKGLKVDLNAVESNIVNVLISPESPMGLEELCEALKLHGVLFFSLTANSIRLVTHYHISEDDVQFALSCFRSSLSSPAAAA